MKVRCTNKQTNKQISLSLFSTLHVEMKVRASLSRSKRKFGKVESQRTHLDSFLETDERGAFFLSRDNAKHAQLALHRLDSLGRFNRLPLDVRQVCLRGAEPLFALGGEVQLLGQLVVELFEQSRVV